MTHPIEALLTAYAPDSAVDWRIPGGDSAELYYEPGMGWMVTLYPALGHTKRTTYPDFEAACAALAKLAGVPLPNPNPISNLTERKTT